MFVFDADIIQLPCYFLPSPPQILWIKTGVDYFGRYCQAPQQSLLDDKGHAEISQTHLLCFYLTYAAIY